MRRILRVGSCLAAIGLFACELVPHSVDLGRDSHEPARADGGSSLQDLSHAPPDLSGLCGDPEKLARYGACTTAQDEASCVGNGGYWIERHIFPSMCQCPTGQEMCSCTRASDCLARCISTQSPCSGSMHGTCASDSSAGNCACQIFDDGTAGELCRD